MSVMVIGRSESIMRVALRHDANPTERSIAVGLAGRIAKACSGLSCAGMIGQSAAAKREA